MKSKENTVCFCMFVLILSTSISTYAQSDDFLDVPYDHPAYNEVTALRREGVLMGNPNNTFAPDRQITRAEAVAMITRSLLAPEHKHLYSTVPWTDVPVDAWYRPFAAYGYEKGILDGPERGRTIFAASSPIRRAELWKMIFLLYGDQPTEYFGEIQLPLASDVADPAEWYYPYMRYGVATSMITLPGSNDTLRPGDVLTRATAATELWRFLHYKQGARQDDLIRNALIDLELAQSSLNAKFFNRSLIASTRALLSARGALQFDNKGARVRGLVKIAEGYQLLTIGRMHGGNELIGAQEKIEKALLFAPDDPQILYHAQYIRSWRR